MFFNLGNYKITFIYMTTKVISVIMIIQLSLALIGLCGHNSDFLIELNELSIHHAHDFDNIHNEEHQHDCSDCDDDSHNDFHCHCSGNFVCIIDNFNFQVIDIYNFFFQRKLQSHDSSWITPIYHPPITVC